MVTTLEPLTFDVYAAADPNALTPMASLDDAFAKSVSITLNGRGAGQFSIPRSSPFATEELIAQGNLVKVRLTEVTIDPIAAFFMEVGDFGLVSSKESGGENLTFGGPGAMSYLNRGIMWSEAFTYGEPDPVDGKWLLATGSHGPKAGAILRWILAELQAGGRPTSNLMPSMSIDFNYTTDSNGETWAATPGTSEYTADVGTHVDDVVLDLVAKAPPMVVEVTPDMVVRAYNNFGVDRTGYYPGDGIVRLEKGFNIATELSRQVGASRIKSVVLVGGDPGFYGSAQLPILPAREEFVQAAGVDTTALNYLGLADLQARQINAESIRLEIPYGDLEGVEYKPGPIGSLGHYWIGDTITLHTGYGPHDYSNSPQRLVEIAIGEDDAGTPIVEVALGSTYSQTESSRIRDFITGQGFAGSRG